MAADLTADPLGSASSGVAGGLIASLRLARRLAVRDWRSGELALLVAALIVATTSVTAIAIFADRLQRALLSESADFLAADRYISSSAELPDNFRSAAAARGIDSADTLLFPSMVFAGDEANQLASIKAVSDGYPLRGVLRTAKAPFEPGRVTQDLPEPGTVWLDARLFPALDVAVGDQIDVGLATLTIDRVITSEPDRGGSMFDMGPRVLMRLEDVPATEVVQPGSRLRYRLLLRGSDTELEALKAELELVPGQRWVSIRDSSPSIGAALDRAESFLLLGGLLAVLLAGIAVALAAHRYARRHFDHVAVLKTLGAPPRQILVAYAGVLALVALAAVPFGLLAGYLLHLGIISVLSALLPVALPAAGIGPFLLGTVTGIICAIAFALPAFLHLRQVAPMNVIRRDLGAAPPSRNLSIAAAAVGFLGLLLWYTKSLELTFWTLAGTSGVLLLFGILAFVLLGGSRSLGARAGSGWRFAVASLQRRRLESVSQLLVFGLALMLLLMLVLLRTALLDEWQSTIPADAPNHFVINIAPEELDGFSAMLTENDVPHELGFAVVRGRIVARNGEDAEVVQARLEAAAGDNPGPRLTSERNLTWTTALPEDNEVIAGQWWESAAASPQVSLEEDYARDLGLKVGDELEFDVGGRRVTAPVTSIRRLAWESMRPNFFIIFSPTTLEDFPATYMTSFFLPRERKTLLNTVLRAYPTVTVIEVDALMAQIKSIIERVTRAVELILYLVLVAGGLVLVASVQASRDARMREHALLRALGATKQMIRGALVIEFAVLGALSGLLAAIGAELTTYLLNAQVFGLPTSSHLWLWVLGPLLGALLIASLGYLSTRSLVQTPPMLALRALD